ncbi:MAG: hypothetical protein IPG17_32710 [Sandaracinaceae bacterium]|nr:hypothetical protein [Sandaracinaceae bacterium]
MNRPSLLALALTTLTSSLAACSGASNPASTTTPMDGADSTVTIEDAIRHLERGEPLDRVCFGESPRGDVMCAVGTRSIQGGATLAIRVLGAEPVELTYYQHPEGEQFLEVDPAVVDRNAIANARNLANAGGFEPLADPGVMVPPGSDSSVGVQVLRRTRTRTGQEGDPTTGEWPVFRDTLELRCGEEFRTIPLEGPAFGHTVGEPTITARALADGTLLLAASVSFSLEGDQGSATDAVIIHPIAICE